MSSILGNEWHISSVGNDLLTENGSITDKQRLYNLALNTDLKEICKPTIHDFTNNETPKVVLQIHKIRNISAPKANEDSQAAPRMLKLTLTDGDTYIQALEFSPLSNISLKNTPPGTKLMLEKAKISSGFLLLTPQNCKILGGKVANLIEKWELTKSVLRNRRSSNEEGPPPWVNFGMKIKTGNQENNFKSISDKTSKETSEFDQQRQDAIAEASSGAVRKVFSGRVKQNVQVPNTNHKKHTDNGKEKKDLGKSKGKSLTREKEVDEKPQKPSEKVSLFAFLEDKLPVTTNQDNYYQSQPVKNTFKEIESKTGDQNKYDYKRKSATIPKQFEKSDTNSQKYQVKNKYESAKKDNTSTTPNSNDTDNIVHKTSNFTGNKPNQSSVSNQYPKNQPRQYKQPQNNYPQRNQQYQPTNIGYNQNFQNNQSNSNFFHQNSHYPENYSQGFQQPPPVNRNFQNANNQSYQKQFVQNNINDVTQGIQKMTVNSQFASRSLRQHLNLGETKRNDDGHEKNHSGRMNTGDEIMAKYWEDGKFYNATIISITDKTFAVKFKGYGNIEEILKTDCHPLPPNTNNRTNFNQDFNRINKSNSGFVEYRRRDYNK